jgi:hypothetical protein
MTDAAAGDPWARPSHSPGGGDALVFVVAFGADVDRLEVSTEDHRVDGVPEGVEIAVLGADGVASFLEPPIGDVLREEDPALVDRAAGATSCIVLRGTIPDPADLHYLRSCIGIATAALDAGAVAIYNLQSFGLFSPARWRADIFEPDRPPAADLVVLLSSDTSDLAPDGAVWLHTRGLRLFGRPDLSVRGVPADQVALAGRLVRALVAQLVAGLVVEDGATMAVGEPIGAIRFHRRGHLDDPEFNNVHLEIDWPDALDD